MRSLYRIIFILLFFFVINASAFGQSADQSAPLGRGNQNDEGDYPRNIMENLAKMRINAARKEFDELVERVKETATISEELNKSYETTQNLNAADTKKIERLEKLVKKIRSQIGAEDAEEISYTESNLNVGSVIKNIKDDAQQLLTEIKKTGRFTVSVVAIESSNSMLKFVRFIKNKARGK